MSVSFDHNVIAYNSRNLQNQITIPQQRPTGLCFVQPFQHVISEMFQSILAPSATEVSHATMLPHPSFCSSLSCFENPHRLHSFGHTTEINMLQLPNTAAVALLVCEPPLVCMSRTNPLLSLFTANKGENYVMSTFRRLEVGVAEKLF